MPTIAAPPGLERDVPLAPLTSLKIGGPADFWFEARDVASARGAIEWARQSGLPFRWLGGGSNTLVSDLGVAGLVARYVAARVELPADTAGLVVAESGRSLSNLAGNLARAGWSGLEWAASVPGTVGGAVVNNAGAFGSEVSEHLAWAEVLEPDGQLRRLAASDLGYSYRDSLLKRDGQPGTLIVRAAFRVRRAPSEQVRAAVLELRRQRTTSQPRQLSAGSIFKNPAGDYAGRLIETVGLKGRSSGGAQFSPRHANFIVNIAGARADDVYALIRLAQEQVFQTVGVWLETELELLGRWTDEQRAALRKPLLIGGSW